MRWTGKQRAGLMDSGLALEQLRYSGVFEAVQIRQSGYPFRLTHKKFILRCRLVQRL